MAGLHGSCCSINKPFIFLQGADRAFAFASGMAAIAAVCRLVKSGEHIVAGDDLYGGTSRLLASVVPNAGIDVSNVDTTDVECVGCRDTPWQYQSTPHHCVGPSVLPSAQA